MRSELGNRIRALFDEEATPIEPRHIPRAVRQRGTIRQPWRIGVVAAAVVLLLGSGALLLRSSESGDVADPNSTVPLSTPPSTLDETPPDGDWQSVSWQWLIDNSVSVGDDLRVALPAATPEPQFDYEALGTEQSMEIGEPDVLPSGAPLPEPGTTIIYAGRHTESSIATYFFRDRAGLVCLVDWSPNDSSAGLSCVGSDSPPDQLISGGGGYDPGQATPPGVEAVRHVSLRFLPTETAAVTLEGPSGETFVVRPILGTATFVIPDDWSNPIMTARAYDAQGNLIATEQHRLTPIPLSSEIAPVRIDCTGWLEGFPCEALIDDDTDTLGYASDGGIDATITLFFESPIRIDEVGFVNSPDDETFARNARARTIEVAVDDLSRTWTAELDDSNARIQWVALDTLQTSVVTITIQNAYPGSSSAEGQPPFRELALAEIVVRGRPAEEAGGAPEATGQAYLGLDLPGWEFVSAYDMAAAVTCAPGGNTFVPVTEWIRPATTEAPERRARVSAGVPCESDLPRDTEDLAPPAESTDIGDVPVLESRAIVHRSDDEPALSVRWLLSDTATGQLLIAGSRDADTARETAAGVVALTSEEWNRLRDIPSQPVDNATRPVFGIDHPDAVFGGGVAIRSPSGPTYELEWILGGRTIEVWNSSTPSWLWPLVFTEVARAVDVRGTIGFYVTSEPGNERYIWHENGMNIFVRVRPAGSDDDILDSLVELTDSEVVKLTGGWQESPDQ